MPSRTENKTFSTKITNLRRKVTVDILEDSRHDSSNSLQEEQ